MGNVKTWAAVLALVAFSFLLAGSLVSSVGNSASTRSSDPTLATATPTSTGQATLDGHSQPLKTPSALAHRQRVLQRFACSDCHGVERGWPVPTDHAAIDEGECRDCHQPAPEPSPIALHTTAAQDPVGEACGLCHGDVAPPTFSVPTNAPICTSCHSTDADQVLPISHAGRSQSPATCVICHETKSLAVPAVPHKLDGWERCTFCHGPQRLTPLTGAHKREADNQCLQCHAVVPDLPNTNANMRELSKEQGGCLSCHAEGRLAPLPGSHTGRADVLCTLCHSTAHEAPPSVPHALAGSGACNRCHVPQDVGALPASHTAWTEQMCVSCHKEDRAPAIPHTLEKRGNCEECHAPSSGRARWGSNPRPSD